MEEEPEKKPEVPTTLSPKPCHSCTESEQDDDQDDEELPPELRAEQAALNARYEKYAEESVPTVERAENEIKVV